MRRVQFHYVIKNYSRYSIDAVWENAQDLEHVSRLHSRTNRFFEILGVNSKGVRPYDAMTFRTQRRLFCFGLPTIGYREIFRDYQLQQIEYIPFLGIKVVLNSVLKRSKNPDFLTELCDEVVIEVPFYFSFLKGYFLKSLKRHTRIQCEEDEPFRERRKVLADRGIRLPFSLFSTPQIELFRPLMKEAP